MRGGLRTRLALDSTRLTIIAGLDALGWFDPTIYDNPPGTRRHRPLRYVPRPQKWDDPVYANALAVSTEDVYDRPLGLGGDVEDTLQMYVDVFAESDPIGWHIAMDIRDVLLGKMPGIGRNGAVIDMFDLRHATPTALTQLEVAAVQVDRAESEARQWQAHWFMVRVELLDDYADEADATHSTTAWQPDLAPSWARIQGIPL